MSLSEWIALIGLVLGFASSLFGGLWVLNRNIQNQFSAMRQEQSGNHHSMDVRLTRIDTTVGPYAVDIGTMKTIQHENVVAIQDLKGKIDNIMQSEERHQRQIENMQNQIQALQARRT